MKRRRKSSLTAQLLPIILLGIAAIEIVGAVARMIEDDPERRAGRAHGASAGSMTVLSTGRTVSEAWMHQYIRENRHAGSTEYDWSWKIDGVNNAAESAPGLDRIHHFVNGYLVGYAPFPAENLWQPWQTIARQMKYEYDHRLFGPQEAWQTSRQAHAWLRGDCEDHAIALTDWLIDGGFDARVAVGSYRGGGHAWVVVIHEGNTFLMEATDKRPGRTPYPLAAGIMGYAPRYMFNRSAFWVNTGSKRTRDYRGPHWDLRSHFTADI